MPHIPDVIRTRKFVDMLGRAAKPDDYSGMLYRIIRVKEFCPNTPHIFSLGMFQECFNPARRYDLDIIIKEKEMVARCEPCCIII
jgi:hypothetical protein